MSVTASAESMRIVRSLSVDFPAGPGKTGTAFVYKEHLLLTCAHVVRSGTATATKVRVKSPSGEEYLAVVKDFNDSLDIALLEAQDENEAPPILRTPAPAVGQPVVFAGLPAGVAMLSVFTGMISNYGRGLISQPRCEVIQISGMVNNGNSGGPLLDAEDGAVIGIVTAKYVPLLREITKLEEALSQIPQIPSDVGLGTVDFGRFVNLTIRSLWQLTAVLRLVQVGTGWAVPVKYFDRLN